MFSPRPTTIIPLLCCISLWTLPNSDQCSSLKNTTYLNIDQNTLWIPFPDSSFWKATKFSQGHVFLCYGKFIKFRFTWSRSFSGSPIWTIDDQKPFKNLKWKTMGKIQRKLVKWGNVLDTHHRQNAIYLNTEALTNWWVKKKKNWKGLHT